MHGFLQKLAFTEYCFMISNVYLIKICIFMLLHVIILMQAKQCLLPFFTTAEQLVSMGHAVVGWGLVLQAGGSRVRFPIKSLDFFNWRNPSRRIMALGVDSQGNGPIQYVETCPDSFFTVRVHTTKSTVKILAANTHCKYFLKIAEHCLYCNLPDLWRNVQP
jgi:hypothetical protein